ncbi:lytic murein transglycosylase [Patulibacter minatonensis]|uniref:lytic murein transglycosylase n=1 Tax=Patulibacter minatonensis TaxID=298163 RepID=UPI0004BBB5F7|nr:lytic murein transglycosylase [Patulibacter minatonensis]
MPSSTRKLLVGLSAAGAVAAGFGATVQAGAEARTLNVTLSGGRTVVVNVDVPPGTPVEQIPLPDLGAPVVSVRDASPKPATVEGQAATGTVPAPGATATTPATTTGVTDPSVDSSVFDDSGGEGRQNAVDEEKRRDAAERRKARTDGTKVTRRKKQATSDDAPATPTTDEPRAAAAADVPNASDPGFTEVLPGATPAGVPNFFIDKFRIPPFLLPIYQAAGIEYGVRWEVLAAINEVETDYGRNLSVSSAGAVGWMQFMPETWKAYGVDANGDGKADPYNPVDAIFAAARYLKAAGGHDHIRKAVFAYNHAGWYVDQVMLRARLVSGLPDDLVGSLTGLTQGVFPVASKTQYAGDDSNRKARAKARAGGNAAKSVESSSRSSIDLYAKAGAPAIAVQDGTVTSIGQGDKLGRYVRLRDVYGNTYTYGNLKKVSALHPVAKDDKTPAPVRHASAKDPVPTKAASAGTQAPDSATKPATTDAPKALAGTTGAVPSSTPAAPVAPSRDSEAVFANPARPLARKNGGAEQLDQAHADDATFSAYLSTLHGLTKDDVVLKRLRKGSRVMAGTILGRLGATSKASPHLKFQVRPAGKDAPLVDPKPILDGWKLLESTTVYRAKASSALFKTTDGASTGQVLLMSKEQLQERVLADPQLDIYAAGRRMVEAGAIDRRVLATLEYLTASGLRIGVSSLRRPGAITSSGNVSEHDSGNAVDISSVNGITISKATQGAGSITEQAIRILLGLQGTLKPHQIISLMTFEGADNTFAMGDHDDHIHVGFRPTVAPGAKLGRQVTQVLKPGQWIKLIDRIADIDNPTVVDTPSKYAVKAPKSGD